MASANDGREGREPGALSARRVENFRRLMIAQEQIVEALAAHGRVSDARIEAALNSAEVALPNDEYDARDFYLPALELFVTALGGRLEPAAAVFPQVTVALDS